jgi:ribosomal protein S18 acetylase RimI-like enzyme
MVRLRAMTSEEFEAYLEFCRADYAAEMVRAGMDADAAEQRSADDTRDVAVDGPDGERHQLFVVEGEDARIGVLWLGARDGWRRTWIYDIRVDDAWQGRGLGRATLEAAEARARQLGAEQVGLHVFAHNEVACRLYETSGYVVTERTDSDLVMWKQLP